MLVAEDFSVGVVKYERIGLCSFCLFAIEAIQPGGRDVRHVETGVAYRECGPAKRELARRELERRSRERGSPFVVYEPGEAA
jgi:hypothetical protein